jgi:hypothetical protein
MAGLYGAAGSRALSKLFATGAIIEERNGSQLNL